jgi:hypothetical protein
MPHLDSHRQNVAGEDLNCAKKNLVVAAAAVVVVAAVVAAGHINR